MQSCILKRPTRKRVQVLFFLIFTVLLFSLTSCVQQTNAELENKIALLEAKIDSLENIIHGKSKHAKKKASAQTGTEKPKKMIVNDLKSIVSDFDEYIKQNEYAREYELRGKAVSAKQSSEQAEKLGKKLSGIFKKGQIVTLVYDEDHHFASDYLLVTDRYKLKYDFYNSSRTGDKPKDVWTSDKLSIKAENIVPGRNYRIKFKVIEDINIPYGGTMSYFSVDIMFLDIDILG